MQSQLWIKAALREEGYKLKDAAALLGVPSPRLTDILQGKRQVQSDELLPLASMLSMGVKSLLKSLSEGKQVIVPGDGPGGSLPVLGQLTGTGKVLPAPSHAPESVPLPADAQSADGLSCYIMGDSSMDGEIKVGDIIIAADPRVHFYPMVPGSIFLISGEDGVLFPRQYMTSEDGKGWLVALPPKPDPSLLNWRFDMLPEELSPGALMSGSTDTGMPDARVVRTADIAAAVLWVQRHYKPVEPA